MKAQVQKFDVYEVDVDVKGLIKQLGSKSAVIRYLDVQGLSRTEIARVLGTSYQHVRAVLLMPLMKEETTEKITSMPPLKGSAHHNRRASDKLHQATVKSTAKDH